MSDGHSLVIHILDKEYRVACPPGEQDNLLRAARYLDNQMREVRQANVIGLERIAIMAALNMSHELLEAREQLGDDSGNDSGDDDSGGDCRFRSSDSRFGSSSCEQVSIGDGFDPRLIGFQNVAVKIVSQDVCRFCERHDDAQTVFNFTRAGDCFFQLGLEIGL